MKELNRLDAKEWMDFEMFGGEDGIIGLLLVGKSAASIPGSPPPGPLLDGSDRLMLVVQDPAVQIHDEIMQWMKEDLRIQVRRVTADMLERWVVGSDRRGVQWLVQGEVLLDKTGYLRCLRNRLEEWPELLRKQKLLCAFSRFIVTYSLAKQDLQNGQVLDAYSHLLGALHHWAHISLVEQGVLPELTFWEQMRRVNPGIYKLYEEMTTSPETLEQRVKLVLLACEFSVLTKMKSSCALLIHLLESRKSPWTIAELQQDERLRGLPIELPLLLQKLVQRGLAREVARSARGRVGMLELQYTAGDQ